MKNVYRLLLFAAVLACMTGIFIFSSQNAEQSNNVSILVTEKLIAYITDYTENINTDIIWQFNGVVRKYAHFAVFFVLGVASTAFFLAVMPRKRVAAVLCALVLCLAWAAADEVHQMYVPGRAGQTRDVMIDFSGAFLGTALTLAVYCTVVTVRWIIKRMRCKYLENKR